MLAAVLPNREQLHDKPKVIASIRSTVDPGKQTSMRNAIPAVRYFV
jgi:hypothetical protein